MLNKESECIRNAVTMPAGARKVSERTSQLESGKLSLFYSLSVLSPRYQAKNAWIPVEGIVIGDIRIIRKIPIADFVHAILESNLIPVNARPLADSFRIVAASIAGAIRSSLVCPSDNAALTSLGARTSSLKISTGN
ncbi:MAG: hypothetical protein Ct9H90mP24_7710 [Methanobacteriota archaeon]|nr:MAG: hypothetical protein Ct9H90mP24_7710 [Euryarchaeota archaeon]